MVRWKKNKAEMTAWSRCRSEERRRQYLVGGYFAIIIQAMFERATKLRRLT